jgi:cytochrome b561
MLLVKDTKDRFGLVSVLLHWYIAVTILFLLLSGSTINFVGVHGPLRPLRESLAWWHMSFAITAAPFILYRIYWRLRFGKPKTHTQHPFFQFTADAVWRLLLLIVACQVITGPSRQLTRPEPLLWFGHTVIAPQAWMVADTNFLRRLHVYGAITIACLLVLHVGGALKHLIFDRDQVFRRMVWPFAPKSEVKTGVEGPERAIRTPVPAE